MNGCLSADVTSMKKPDIDNQKKVTSRQREKQEQRPWDGDELGIFRKQKAGK